MVIGLFKKPFNAARPGSAGDNRDFVSPREKILECVENLLFPSSYLFALPFPPFSSPSPTILCRLSTSKERKKKKK